MRATIALGIAAYVLAVGLAATVSPADAATPCRTEDFQTTMVKQACEHGGKKAARNAMRKFVKRSKETREDLTCDTCHAHKKPTWTLRDEALSIYRELGGS